jgi:hypothetical protein
MIATRSGCLALVLVLAGCADRQVDIEDEPSETEPTCMILPARGHWDDGASKTINNEWGTVGSVCLCLTEEERESESVREELNGLAYAECNRISTLQWDFDWTDCEELYETDAWLGGVFVALDEHAWKNPTGLMCDEIEQTSCSMREHQSPLALLVFMGLLSLRLRSTSGSSATQSERQT